MTTTTNLGLTKRPTWQIKNALTDIPANLETLDALFVDGVAKPNHEETLTFFVAGAQTTGTLKDAVLVGLAGTIVDVRARILTAPVGSTFIVDVNKNGTTLFTTQANRPTVADGANTSSTTAPDVTSVAAGDYISIDIDQIGSGTAGSNLMVSVTLKRTNVA